MRWGWISTFLLVFSLFLLKTSPAFADDAENQVLTLVNTQRAQQGLQPLVLSSALTGAARSYARVLATEGFFSHTGLDGSTFISRDEAAGYTGWDYLEENLAGGQSTPDQVVAAWMASPEHRANILSPNVREIGIGHVYASGSKYLNYWVEEFGDRPGVQPVSFSLPSTGGTNGAAEQSVVTPAITSEPLLTTWTAPTGRVVSDDWLRFFRANGGVDNFGLPLTGVVADPGNPSVLIQVFQRAVFRLLPTNADGSRVQRILLGDILYPGADPPVSPNDAPPGPSEYFPLSPDRPTGLGHFVANYTPDGHPTYFKDYFDSHGGVAVFGYPKEEPKLRDGLWTQRFQAAVFQYHPEDDRDGDIPGTTTPWRTYRVQLELLGSEYLGREGLSPN